MIPEKYQLPLNMRVTRYATSTRLHPRSCCASTNPWIERKIDRILKELERSEVGQQASGEGRDEVADAPVYDDLTLDEAGFESY